jgi:hypothetical protein
MNEWINLATFRFQLFNFWEKWRYVDHTNAILPAICWVWIVIAHIGIIQDNFFIVVTKFCDPFYITGLSLICDAHLLHWHVDLSDIQVIKQNYNDSEEIIPNIFYLSYCGSSALLIWFEPWQTLSRIFLIPKETLKTTGQRMQWMNVAKFLKLWKKYTSLLYCITSSLSFGDSSLHQHVE